MYNTKKFSIPELKGISKRSVEEHIKLYEGYVKNTNIILESLMSSSSDSYATSEMQRRLSFEFNGMRNHEYYFSSLEDGPVELEEEAELRHALKKQWGSFDAWKEQFVQLAKTRGVGWAVLSYDPHVKKLIHGWVDEQHIGHLLHLAPVLMLDMWEHSYVHDYHPSGKANYIDDFFANLNWSVIDGHFESSRL